ncbi:MAG: hypothetical protein P4L16_07420 [Chlamydiales bacterium]|nr:hypothetical protein [Chlamydiales bacterium]
MLNVQENSSLNTYYSPIAASNTAASDMTSNSPIYALLGLLGIVTTIFLVIKHESVVAFGRKCIAGIKNILHIRTPNHQDTTASLIAEEIIPVRASASLSEDEHIRKHCLELDRLSCAINSFDSFVKSHPDLLALFKKYMLEHEDAIAMHPKEPNNVSLLVSLQIRCCHLEHRINERIVFVQSHEEVAKCLKGHLCTIAEDSLLEFRKCLLPALNS